MKKSSENNLLPITDKSSPAMPSDEELKSETPDIKPPVVKISPPATLGGNIPATVSSVDQIGISSVDLDISKAVEKGISDAKKEDPSTPQDVAEVPKDEVSKENKTESKCKTFEENKDISDISKLTSVLLRLIWPRRDQSLKYSHSTHTASG